MPGLDANRQLVPFARFLAYWVLNTKGVPVALLWQQTDGVWCGTRFSDGVTVFAGSSVVCQRRLFIVPPRTVAPGWVWVARFWWLRRRYGGYAVNTVVGQVALLKLGRCANARFVVIAANALRRVLY